MDEQLITFETAKLAKEKGFRLQSNPFGYVTKFYNHNTKTLLAYGRTGKTDLSKAYYAPTQSLLQRWLREVHRIYVYIKPIHNLDINGLMLDNWEICIEDYMGSKFLEESIYIHGYEEALEVGLFEALKLIKDETNTH